MVESCQGPRGGHGLVPVQFLKLASAPDGMIAHFGFFLLRDPKSMSVRQVRLSTLSICIGIYLFGCIGPVVNDMTTEFPATVLNVVGTSPATDGRKRFREIFCHVLAEESADQLHIAPCDRFLFQLSDEALPDGPPRPLPTLTARYRILIVPGFLNECFSDIALPFEDGISEIESPRVKFEYVVVSGRSSSDVNAADIDQVVRSLKIDSDEKLVLIGHSKGAADILHFLRLFPDTARRVSAVVSIAGAINGSRLAEKAGAIFSPWVRDLLLDDCDSGDGMALYDLRPAVSMSWLADNPLPESVRYFSIAAFAGRDNINAILKSGYDLLSICDSRNDGLLLISDQIIPGGTLLGYVNADHLSVALPLENINLLISSTIQSPQDFPRRALLLAILDYLDETVASKSEKIQIEN